MRSRRQQRSSFNISDEQRKNVREAALTMAQQGLSKPMVQAEDARPGGRTPMVEAKDARPGGAEPMVQAGDAWGRRSGGAPNTREIPSHPHQDHRPGNQEGTYNGAGAGSTAGNTGGGVELMARVIVNQARGPAAPRPMRTPKGPRWPKSNGRTQRPFSPRRG